MKTWILPACFTALAAATTPAVDDYAALKREAETRYAQGSYARAHEDYLRAMKLPQLGSNEVRWVRFRLADTQWRSTAFTELSDTTELDGARTALEHMVRDVTRPEEKDRVWVEVQESLGDFHWTQRRNRDWHRAWPYYERALDWWAGQSDLNPARERYLSIIGRCVRPQNIEPYYRYGRRGNYLPLPILQNALSISQSEDDKARAHYLIAATLQQQGGGWEQQARVAEHYEAALALGRRTDWYDDALFNYAQWMEQRGRFVPLENGDYRSEPDYVKALALYRRLVSDFDEGETRYFDQAEQQIKDITATQLGVSVANIFLPESEIQFHLNWRNVKRVDLALYPVDLTRDVDLGSSDDKHRLDWLNSIDLAGRETVKEWTFVPHRRGRQSAQSIRDASERRPTAAATADEDYRPGNETVRFDDRLATGAYVLLATAGGKSARDLILVTDAAVVLKTSGKQALVYFCDALTGAPVPDSDVTLWTRWKEGSGWQSRKITKTADRDGLAVFKLPRRENTTELFVGARYEDRQAFSTGRSWWGRDSRDKWKIYAFTDRPAYRPKETVHWKFTARRHNGSVYSTPSDERIEFEITDPRGAKVESGTAALNQFGSAWGSLKLTGEMPLGEYRIQFRAAGRKNRIGGATLFRLEEYKLPEFKVTVSTPEEESGTGVSPASPRKKIYRLGDTVEATIQAEYYFGGPVSDAAVEVVVYQNPFRISWPQPRQFPWFYQDMDPGHSRWGRSHGHGQTIKREMLKTDANGQAVIRFETPANDGRDYEYRIEARVRDSSRREIVGAGAVRVTRQLYYVNAHAQHNLYRPEDKVTIELQAQDANENPVEVEGTVTVTRQYWWEIWLKPDGTEVKGDDLNELKARHPVWPPPPERPDQKGWKLKFRGYEQDEILTRTVKTDTNGTALFTFEPDRIGYYRVGWTSEDTPVNRKSQLVKQVRAETMVWVTDNESTDIGYRHDGVEIIADKDTFRVGSEAPVMLAANSTDRYVLFTVEGEDLHSYRLVHLTGTVKLLNVLIGEEHVPNIFLGATMVGDREIHTDTRQLVVPPTKNFLAVEVTPDREHYQPRENGTLTVTTKNNEGQPVSAEVALSLVDESVFYIQSEYAGDPRQFFFGAKRPHAVRTQSTLNQKRYVKLVEGENEELWDERDGDRAGYRQDNEAEAMAYYDYSGERASRQMGRGQDESRWGTAMPAAEGGSGLMAAKSVMAKGSMVLEEMADDNIAGLVPADSEPAIVVRSDFRSTVLWQPDVKTGPDGSATVEVTYPDSVTSWKATARAATPGNQFGIAAAATRTKQPLIVRLQAPRFFVVGDEVALSAVVNNNTDKALDAKVTLDVEGGLKIARASGLRAAGGTTALRLTIPANGKTRADWKARVIEPGEVKLKVTARGAAHADAMERTYPIYEHGIEKFISKSGKVRGDEIIIALDIPKERKADSTSLTVQVTPSMAVTMLDALPYLIDYPYGCTEQTMSRFLPSVITAKTLRDLGLYPEDVMGRVFGGIEARGTGLRPVSPANTPRGGTPQEKDLTKLDDMTRVGLARLYDFQHSDGGWGWWKEGDSDHWMTAYVVWGLTLAKEAGVKVRSKAIRRGAEFLDKNLVEVEERPDMQAWMLHALAAQKAADKESGLSKFQQTAFNNLWKKRDGLNAYTRALFALAAHHLGKADEAAVLVDNLENGVIRDNRPDQSVLVNRASSNVKRATSQLGTTHWGEDGIFWRWSDGGVEATAFALRALLTIDPDNQLIEPVTNWLIKNRRGAQWSNTRDTAIVVLAMNDYLRVSGELNAEMEFQLFVNGKSIAERKVSGADVFNAPSRFEVDARLIKDGANEIRITRKGEGPVYFAAEATFFSLEEPIPAVGNEIFVKRQYFKLVGRPTLLKGYIYDKVPLLDGERVDSGERVETVITIEAKNNYEYLVFEDLKPAGFEAVAIRSGQSTYARELKRGALPRKASIVNRQSPMDFTGRSRWVYQELRDRKVALFIDKLPEGVWQIRYNIRAEVPGTFHALPVLGHAMYVPEIRCHGDELRVTVTDMD